MAKKIKNDCERDEFGDIGKKPDHRGSHGSSSSLGFFPKITGKTVEALKQWSEVTRFSFLKGNSDYIVQNGIDKQELFFL